MTSKVRIPFPDLPVPTKSGRIARLPRVNHAPVHVVIPTSMPAPPSPPTPRPQVQERPTPPRTNIRTLDIQDPIVGGELIPEESLKIDMGDHVVEGLDPSDYQC